MSRRESARLQAELTDALCALAGVASLVVDELDGGGKVDAFTAQMLRGQVARYKASVAAFQTWLDAETGAGVLPYVTGELP